MLRVCSTSMAIKIVSAIDRKNSTQMITVANIFLLSLNCNILIQAMHLIQFN